MESTLPSDEIRYTPRREAVPEIAVKLQYARALEGRPRFRESHPLSSPSSSSCSLPLAGGEEDMRSDGPLSGLASAKKRARTERSPPASDPRLRETDDRRLAGRQKQIDYGKNTIGYRRYLEQTPRRCRRREHPRTPDKHQICSKRSWDGQIAKWRRALHAFDPSNPEPEQ